MALKAGRQDLFAMDKLILTLSMGLLAVWLAETVFFLLSYRASTRADGVRTAERGGSAD
jgi:hypothetical protein